MNEFSLNIELGNDDMGDVEAVARALLRVADQVREGRLSAVVFDGNGNNVGEWSFS